MSMKKISYIALAALAAVACVKEADNAAPEVVKGTPITVRAYVAPETKTAYEGEKTFSWVEGDNVSLMVVNDETGVPDVISLTAASTGATTDLVGTMVDGYSPADYAFYPKDTGDSYYSSDLGPVVDAENKVMNLRMWGTITPDLANPMASIPLIGKRDADGNYAFKTATGILKITVENIPADAYFLQLDHTEAVALNGNFSFGEDCTIYMSNVVGTPWPQKYVSFTPEAEGETRTFYVPIPVGTIPAGLTVSISSSSRGNLVLATTKDAIEIVRNRIVATPKLTVPAQEWKSLGNGKFIDSFVWAENGFAMTPVEVEFFESISEPGTYRIANPYAAAATANGKVAEGADDYLGFSLAAQGRVSYPWVNMGLSISNNTEKKWAMISGNDVASYGSDFSHVVSFKEDGTPAQLQLAPCYRTSDENHTGAPSDYENEVGKDHENGIVSIVFPGCEKMLSPFTLDPDNVTVSANQSGDGTGAAGIIDGNLGTYWHTPWDHIDDKADATYGQYVDIILPEYATSLAFNYCTRNTSSQNGSPAMVVIGGSKDGKNFTVLGSFELDYMKNVTPNTWVGLPAVDASEYPVVRFGVAKNWRGDDLRVVATAADEKWCNLAELMVYAVGTGTPVTFEMVPDYIEEGQVWLKQSMIYACNSCSHDGDGVPALIDGDFTNFWHSDWYYAVTTNDPEYGIYFDITLKTALDKFHFEYVVRSNSDGAKPTQIVIGVSDDGTNWTKVDTFATADMLNAAAGARVKLPAITCESAHKYLRFGISDSSNTDTGSLTGDLNFDGYKKCVNLAELMLFAD